MLIEMMKELLKTDGRARLLIVGSDNYDGKYIKLAKELNVENRVDFLGHREDIEVLLHACDVAVASSIREGLPVNVMEALACGLPVVLSDNRGHRELVSEGENGFLVSVNDSGKMAEKVAEILSDSELYSRLSSGAAELVKPYSKENVGEEMKKIYLKFIV